jgi:hypothetical protein
MDDTNNSPLDPILKIYIEECIKNNIKKEQVGLKRRISEISNKLDFVECSDFQKQISLLDDKINNIETSLSTLEAQQKEQLMFIQRYIAGLNVNSNCTILIEIIDTQLKNANLNTQIYTDAGSIKGQIRNSNTPFDLAKSFYNKWEKILIDNGAHFIKY